jgi:hypothetical protein
MLGAADPTQGMSLAEFTQYQETYRPKGQAAADLAALSKLGGGLRFPETLQQAEEEIAAGTQEVVGTVGVAACEGHRRRLRAWVGTAEVYAAAAASRVSSARSIAEVHEGRAVTPHCHLFCHPWGCAILKSVVRRSNSIWPS